ncbi:MAG: prepilin-type N-terminal cleavage/methylation domain-containing protein [Gallionella sp.]|nr:prepilin-type N-terminal cleavage/methylation domain-containing protein [Gallionella sp.]
MKRNQSGFTLIEIAIVLVIIGLLLGGVLKGQELINSAKVKDLANDFKNIPVLIYGYQDKFRSLPGDDPNADTHVAGTKATPGGTLLGDGTLNGTWDSVTATNETVVFWQHVRLAGLSTGLTTVTTTGGLLDPYFPANTLGGRIGIQGNLGTADAPRPIAAIPGSYVICSANIPGKFARQLDVTMDDGATNTGSMRATAAKAGTTAVNAGQDVVTLVPANDDTLYTVCMGV